MAFQPSCWVKSHWPVLRRFVTAYSRGVDAALPVLQKVHDDRVRFWQRISVDRDWFSFKELAMMFGWLATENDREAVVLMTSKVIRIVDVDQWQQKGTKNVDHLYHLERCGVAMRKAAFFIDAFIRGGMPPATRKTIKNLLEKC